MTDYGGLLRALAESSVRFIVVGGAAAIAHGATRFTQDIDVVYDRSRDNLERLVAALEPLSPYLRDAPPGLPFLFDVETLERGVNFTLTTDLGPLDILGEIVGGGTFENLSPHTLEIEVFGVSCRCLDLPRLIQAKRAAGRPKDFDALAELEAILDERSE